MPARDKLRALRLVERISRHKLERLGSELGALRAEQARLERNSRELSSRAAEEARLSGTETRPYLPAFLSSVDNQQRVWAEQAAALEKKSAELETRLLSAFGELKTRETIRARAEDDIAQAVERAENAMLDDAGRILFLANRADRPVGG